jgi:hypothetical protein
MTPVKLGFCMEGLEEKLSDLITDVIARQFGELTYMEIGIGHGGTISGLSYIMDCCLPNKNWRSIGVELPKGYSFNRATTTKNAHDRCLDIEFVSEIGWGAKIEPKWGAITVYLFDSQTFIPYFWVEPLHLVLIDGCHGKKCAMADFVNTANFIVPGGYALFHDFGKAEQGTPQKHCPTIDVRGACEELGLLDGKCKGWEFVGELTAKAGAGNMGVFKKL